MRTWMMFAACIFAVLLPKLAWADCDKMVNDETNTIKDIGRIEAAARLVVNQGATVRVRIVKDSTVYSGGLAGYDTHMRNNCKTWRESDGDRRYNLIAVLYSLDGKLGIVYGRNYVSALKYRTKSIREEKILPLANEKRVAEGMVSGLNAIENAIVDMKAITRANATPTTAPRSVQPTYTPPQMQQPSLPTTPLPVSPPVQPTAPIVVQPAAPVQPTDFSGLWIVLGILVALLAIGALIIGITRARRRREQYMAACRAAQQEAQASSSACANRVNTFDQTIDGVAALVKATKDELGVDEYTTLASRFEQLKANEAMAATNYADLQGSANDPMADGRSVEEYVGMNSRFQKVSRAFQDVQQECDAIRVEVERLQGAVLAAHKRSNDLTDVVQKAKADIEVVREEGYEMPEANTLMTQLEREQASIATLLSDKKFSEVAAACARVEDMAAKAVAAAQAVPKRHAQIMAQLGDVADKVTSLDGAIATGVEHLDQIKREHVAATWQHCAAHVDQAREGHLKVKNTLDDVRQHALLEHQRWMRAEAGLSEAVNTLESIHRLLHQVAALKQTLEAAKRDAGSRIENAVRALRDAKVFVESHVADVKSVHATTLQTVARSIDEARAELAQTSPNYLRVVECANEGASMAQGVLREAEAEHRHAVAQRAEAARLVTDAHAKIAEAAGYISANRADVGQRHDASLGAARSSLTEAERATDVSRKISVATSALSQAQAALSSAQQDVRVANQERQRAVDAINAASRAISEAASYMTRNAADIGYEPRRLLEEARNLLTDAQRTMQLSERIRTAETAASRAAEAERIARREVADADAERERIAEAARKVEAERQAALEAERRRQQAAIEAAEAVAAQRRAEQAALERAAAERLAQQEAAAQAAAIAYAAARQKEASAEVSGGADYGNQDTPAEVSGGADFG